MEWLFGLFNEEVRALHAVLHSIYCAVLLVFGSFLSEGVAGYEVHWGVMIRDNSPDFL